MKTLQILSRFYHLNPRWLYLAFTIVLLIPLLATVPKPRFKSARGPLGLYKTLGECPPGGVILLESSWDLGAKPEALPQLECFTKDLCKRKMKFVMFSTVFFGPLFANDVMRPILEEAGYKYGEDWVNLGFIKPPSDNMSLLVDAFCRDVHGTRPVDFYGTPVKDIPLMRNVKTAKDFYMAMSISYSPDPVAWLSFGKSQHGLPVAFGSAAIMAPYYYAFLDSGQLSGLLAGIRGAYEYESLIGMYGQGSKAMMFFAFGLCFLIFAVLMGNLGFWASARLRRKP